MTRENLNKIIENHSKWLNGESDGDGADLRGADLQDADLRDADLQRADLRRADLQRADLRGADLRDAGLRGADLREADLQRADLQRANLRDADLRDADLQGADLQGADLRGADLQGADLRGADLRDAKEVGTILNLQCPEEGSFIAWKKLKDEVIAKLLIPEDAFRSSATSRKCRASKAVVLAIYKSNGEPVDEARSQYDCSFVYKVGEAVYPDSWDEDRWDECSNGIHFFITRKEAEEY